VYASDETVWRDVVARRPSNLKALGALANAVLARGDVAEAERLARSLVKRMENVPGAEGHAYLPTAYNRLGSVLVCAGKWQEAETYLRRALALRPEYVPPRYNLALLFASLGRDDDALRELDTALRHEPRYVQAHLLEADLLARRGEHVRAASRYGHALQLDPDHVVAKCELAWLLAASPEAGVRDGKKAAALAVSACETLQWKSARALDILGAAYAEEGRFAEAEAAGRRALALLGGEGGADPVARSSADPREREAIAREVGERVELYRQGKPFRAFAPGERKAESGK
jgi:tetratricopeptide (TPR) repeat protein